MTRRMVWSSNDIRKMEARESCMRGESWGMWAEVWRSEIQFGICQERDSIRNEHLMIHLILPYIKMERENGS